MHRLRAHDEEVAAVNVPWRDRQGRAAPQAQAQAEQRGQRHLVESRSQAHSKIRLYLLRVSKHGRIRTMKNYFLSIQVGKVSACVFSFWLVAAAGCGGTGDTSATADMAKANTLTLKNVPTGCPTTETAADLYTSVVMNNCAVAGCHGTGGTSFQLSSAADLHAKLVGQRSNLYSQVTLPIVTASSVDQSFLMYKITGSQGSYGSQMPNTGTALTSAQICKFVAWISSGAN